MTPRDRVYVILQPLARGVPASAGQFPAPAALAEFRRDAATMRRSREKVAAVFELPKIADKEVRKR
jgi:hypothetical protein